MAYLVGQQPAAFLVGPRSGSHKCEAMLMTYSGFLDPFMVDNCSSMYSRYTLPCERMTSVHNLW